MISTTQETLTLQSAIVLPAALRAIHHVLISARLEALDWSHNRKPVDAKKMVNYLDAVEILPELVRQNWNGSFAYFRELLAAIGEEFPELRGLVSNFDREVSGDTLFESNPDISTNGRHEIG